MEKKMLPLHFRIFSLGRISFLPSPSLLPLRRITVCRLMFREFLIRRRVAIKMSRNRGGPRGIPPSRTLFIQPRGRGRCFLLDGWGRAGRKCIARLLVINNSIMGNFCLRPGDVRRNAPRLKREQTNALKSLNVRASPPPLPTVLSQKDAPTTANQRRPYRRTLTRGR